MTMILSRGARLGRFGFENGKTRGGGTEPPGPERTEKTHFSAKRQAVWFETFYISNHTACHFVFCPFNDHAFHTAAYAWTCLKLSSGAFQL